MAALAEVRRRSKKRRHPAGKEAGGGQGAYGGRIAGVAGGEVIIDENGKSS
jgi:hypothetical protein